MSEPGVDRHLIYRFGHCRFDNRTLELTVHDQTVALEPKPLALLLSLLQQAGEVVTKDELHDSVWPGRLLSESVLTKTMAKLRQALQDDEQQIIKTVHGFGYRLVAPVSLVYREPDRPPPQLNFGAGDTPPLRPNWRLRVALGRGGFGEVWLAEHDKTGDQRVFKFGLDARGLTALKREITLSRLLKHIHGDRQDLVHILDWNLEQPPYFLETEFADGGALSQWAQRQGGLHSIALAQRLELVAQAADALAAAHIAGVVHKDLKPSNLLVQDTAVGAPQLKLADFGSGRLFDPEPIAGLDITRLGFTQTQHGQDSTTGTPAYFAPELLAGQQPTIRSDIYALGVILYQMVVGDFTRPLAPGWEEQVDDPLLRQDIADSAASDAERRLGEASALARRLRTLEQRRAEIQQQHAAAERSAQMQAELQQASRRRRRALMLAASLAAFSISISVMWFRVDAARDAAVHERAVAAAVSEFLVEDLIAAANPFNSGRSDVAVAEVLDHGAATAAQRFAGLPLQEAAVRLALGRAYFGIGNYPAALSQLEASAKLSHSQGAAGALIAQAADLQRLDVLDALDRQPELQRLAAQLLAAPAPATGLLARGRLARSLLREGDIEGSLQRYAELSPAFDQQFGAESVEAANLHEAYGLALREAGHFEQSAAELQQAVALRSRLYGKDDLRTLDAQHSLAGTWYLAGELAQAEPAMALALERARSVLGPAHYRTQIIQIDLASVYQAAGDLARAQVLMSQALQVLQAQFGEDHKDVRTALNNLGLLAEDLGQPEASIAYLKRAMDAELRAVGPQNPSALTAVNNYARALGLAGRWREAEAIQAVNLAHALEVLPADHWHLAVLRYNWAQQLGELGRRDQALELFDLAIAALSEQLGNAHPATARARALKQALLERTDLAPA